MASRRSARISTDPEKYIRAIKGGRYQARPWLEGRRYDLGTFATRGAARIAIQQFWRGEIVAKPRFVKKIHTAVGVRYIAVVHVPGEDGVRRTIRVGDRYLTPVEAQGAAINYLDETLGEEARIAMMARR